ncbi:MAG: iron chelate uptake ABC transporter family permease subunit [Actinomycetota bacterium]
MREAGARNGRRRGGRGLLAALALLLAGSVLVAVAAGAVRISPATIVRLFAWKLGLAGPPDNVPDTTAVILFQLRLPRVVLAGIVGAALAVSGAVFQALFRNALADPAIIGVSSGAALGAIAVLLTGTAGALGGLAVSGAAFVGALLTAFLVYRLARIGPTVHVTTLLLGGIAVAAVISACMTLVMSFSSQSVQSIYFWLLGGLGQRGWGAIAIAGPLVGAGLLAAALFAGHLNLSLLGEERSGQLGLDVERFKRVMLVVGSLLAAAAVSVSGLIGFVGLMTPHILRLVGGPDHRILLPSVVLGGASFMILADLASRVVVSPEEIPVGAVTALLGGPFFLWLLRREQREASAHA